MGPDRHPLHFGSAGGSMRRTPQSALRSTFRVEFLATLTPRDVACLKDLWAHDRGVIIVTYTCSFFEIRARERLVDCGRDLA